MEIRKQPTTKRYFDTFDALRFFAFFAVFLLHTPTLAIPGLTFFQHGGGIGVSFFFVLSGFLISYLILLEKQQTGKLHLKNFFMRRILRIWPLYYLMVFFAFCTPPIVDLLGMNLSDQGYHPNWLMSVTFLENYKMIIENDLPNTSPLAVMWSLCVEEHFYLIWGIVLYFVRINRMPFLIGISIVVACISRFIFEINNWATIDIFTNIDYFAYGAIPAYLLVVKKEEFEKKITESSLRLRYAMLIFAALSVLIIPNFSLSEAVINLVYPLYFGILFAGIVTIIAPSDNQIIIGRKNILSRLGKYTYGLYLYHIILIQFFKQIFFKYNLSLSTVGNSILFFSVTLLSTILVSMASYYFFEEKFLQLKKRF